MSTARKVPSPDSKQHDLFGGVPAQEGGIAPDYANIGRFIVLHEDSLTQGFFESLTRAILKAGGSSSTRLAGDGTVIEAACSHYSLLREEAVKARAQAAVKAVERARDDQAAQQEQQRSR